MPKDIVQLILATNIDSASVGSSYLPINASGLPFGCFKLFITNASTQDVLISTDGSSQYEYVIKGTRIVLDGQNNAGPGNQKCYFPKGMVFYAKGTAGTGNIYLTGEYQPD